MPPASGTPSGFSPASACRRMPSATSRRTCGSWPSQRATRAYTGASSGSLPATLRPAGTGGQPATIVTEPCRLRAGSAHDEVDQLARHHDDLHHVMPVYVRPHVRPLPGQCLELLARHVARRLHAVAQLAVDLHDHLDD